MDVQKIQYEILHPNKKNEKIHHSIQKISFTCAAITSIRFKTAIRAVTSFGAIVFIADGVGDVPNDDWTC